MQTTTSLIVDATRDVVTQGHYLGEEGTGYRWGRAAEMGDYSAYSSGRVQGYLEPCRIEITVPGAEFRESVDGRQLLYVPAGTRDREGYEVDHVTGLTAAEALTAGFARVLPP